MSVNQTREDVNTIVIMPLDITIVPVRMVISCHQLISDNAKVTHALIFCILYTIDRIEIEQLIFMALEIAHQRSVSESSMTL